MLQDLAALTPPVIVGIAVLIGAWAIVRRELAPNQEIVFSLLSLLLGGSADALATLRKTESLTSQINTLSGLLPVCSWCRKVRNDSGYWEQIEKYISSRTSTSFTHGICPECEQKCLCETN